MKPPTPRKEVQNVIGVINYYPNIWPRRSHKLAPLTKLTSINRKFQWANAEQYAFGKIKRIVDRNTLLTYPDFNETFKIYTNASAFQLGVFISKKGKPIAVYSIKLNGSQQLYTVTERELLSTVDTLKEFRTILLGQQLGIYTDNKNLTCKKINTDRVLRWRLIF